MLMMAAALFCGVTVIVALGMLIARLRRTSRLNRRTGGLSAASAVVALLLCVFVGSLTVEESPEPSSAEVPLKVTSFALEHYQLETLAVP